MDGSYQYPGSAYTNGQYAPQPGAYPATYTTAYGASQYPAPGAPQIRNPFAPTTVAAAIPGAYSEHNAQFDPEGEQAAAQWSAAYAPVDQQQLLQQQSERGNKKGGKQDGNANYAPLGPQRGGVVGAALPDSHDPTTDEAKKNLTVRRKGGGETWEDKTLLEWDPTQFRIMVGNLAGEVTDDSLAKAFAAYGVSKARVVREKRTTKSKGYGFVAFTDAEQGFKAAKEMVGKYIGSHPVTIQRSKTNLNPVVVKGGDRGRGQGHWRNNNEKRAEKSGKGKGIEAQVYGNNHNQQKKGNGSDPLRAKTGAGVEKKSNSKPHLKLLG